MKLRFSKPQQFLMTSLQSICLFLAGVGSGKTYIIGVLSGYFIKNFPKVPGFIAANTYLQLSQSTLFRVMTVWKEIYGWEENIDYVLDKKPPKGYDTTDHNFKSYSGIISFKWGTVVFVGSLDNAKAHDGKEFGWAFLDETKDSRESDVKDVILARLRSGGIYINKLFNLTLEKYTDGILNDVFNPLYILTSPAKVDWINQWFELGESQHEILSMIYNKDEFFTKEFGDKSVVISSTFHNEKNLPKGYIQKQIANRTEEKAKMLIYGNPFVKTGGEFYSGFDRLKHVSDKAEFKPHLPIHIALDQNVKPYITMTLYQVEVINRIRHITQFDEICLSNPRNKTNLLCLEFIRRWGAKCNGLFFYGDPSGKNSDTRGEHDYQILKRILRKYLNNRSNRVPYSHPRVLKRKDFANNIFEGIYNIIFTIHPRCKKSIADFEFLKEDKNGKKFKELEKDQNGSTFEKYGHTSDSFDYFNCKINERLFHKEFK